jgi:hypothetical protein
MLHSNTEYTLFKARSALRASRRGAIRRERLRRGALRAFRSLPTALPYVLACVAIFGFSIGHIDAGVGVGSAAVVFYLKGT